jgi:hypothetical protein
VNREELEAMIAQAKRERDAHPDWKLPLVLTPETAMALVASLQLALRHPGNQGMAAEVARATIDGVIARFAETGLLAFAMLAALGDDPNVDVVWRN